MSCALRSRAVALHDADRHVALHDAAADAADAEQPDVRVVVEARHLQLQRAFRSTAGGGHVLTIASNSGVMSPERASGSVDRVALERRGVDHGEIELLVARAEPVEEIERLIEHPARACAVAVDLVDDDDRREAVRNAFWSRSASAASGRRRRPRAAARRRPSTARARPRRRNRHGLACRRC